MTLIFGRMTAEMRSGIFDVVQTALQDSKGLKFLARTGGHKGKEKYTALHFDYYCRMAPIVSYVCCIESCADIY